MIIDSHVHIFPDEVIKTRNSLTETEPVFETIYKNPASKMVSASDLLGAMNTDSIDISIVCGFPWHDLNISKLHNDYILQSADDNADRLIPLACVNPVDKKAVSEAERALASGAKGLGEIAVYDRDIGDESVLPGLIRLASLCAEADVPMLLHTNEPVGHEYPGKSPMTLAGLYKLIKACPKTKFQLAHLGGGIFSYLTLKKETKDILSNCVFDTAAAPFLYEPDILKIWPQIAGENTLLFGSDYPLLSIPRYIRDSDTADISAAFTEKYYGLNAAEFWNIK